MIVYFTYFLLFLLSYQVAATAFHMKLNNITLEDCCVIVKKHPSDVGAGWFSTICRFGDIWVTFTVLDSCQMDLANVDIQEC